MNGGVLIDTSAWVEFFRGRNKTVCDHVAELIAAERACCNGLVLGELLYGARGVREGDEILAAFRSLPIHVDTPAIFAEAGRLGAELRDAGVTVPLSDCVIAAQARREKCSVLTMDRHFRVIAEHFRIALENRAPGQ